MKKSKLEKRFRIALSFAGVIDAFCPNSCTSKSVGKTRLKWFTTPEKSSNAKRMTILNRPPTLEGVIFSHIAFGTPEKLSNNGISHVATAMH